MITVIILFLCPHHAAKSVIAAAYFNCLVEQLQLSFRAESAGTEPDAAVSPVVVEMLQADGIDVSRHQPRHVTMEQLQTATRVISMGCRLDELEIAPEHFETWSDIPPVSENPRGAQTAIQARVDTLVRALQEAI